MPKCKNCENYNCKNKSCNKNNSNLTEKEIYINVGLCKDYIPTISYILEERSKTDEVFF